MDTNAKTLLGLLELLAVLCAVLTFPEFLKDRQCVHCFLARLRFCVHYCIDRDAVQEKKPRFARFFDAFQKKRTALRAVFWLDCLPKN